MERSVCKYGYGHVKNNFFKRKRITSTEVFKQAIITAECNIKWISDLYQIYTRFIPDWYKINLLNRRVMIIRDTIMKTSSSATMSLSWHIMLWKNKHSYGTHSDVIEQWILLFCKSSKCREESRGQRHIYRKTIIEKERKFIYYGVEVTAYCRSKKMIDTYIHTSVHRWIDR